MARRIAIVIPTANPDREPARTAIARARETTAHLDASLHVITSSGPGFRFSRSVNRGMAEAPDADAWVLLNDDCFMDDGWLEAMLEAVRAHPNVGVVGAVLRFPGKGLQHGGGYMSTNPVWFLTYHTFRNLAPFWALRTIATSLRTGVVYFGHYRRLKPSRRLDFVTGACFLITRACRDRIGGFDEDYEFSYEDVDYCLRAVDAGFEVALAAQARGVHLERATGGHLQGAIRRSLHAFHAKWPRARLLALRRTGRRGVYHGLEAAQPPARR